VLRSGILSISCHYVYLVRCKHNGQYLYSPYKFRSAVLVFRCHNQTAPNYLARDRQWADMDDSRRRLRSATTQRLLVRRARLRTIGDRAFGAVTPRVWNDLSADIVSAPSLAILKRRLKTHLFGQSFGGQLTLLPVLEALLTAG